MKKFISILSIVALLSGVNIAAANSHNKDDDNQFRIQSKTQAESRIKIGWPKFDWKRSNVNQFVVLGTVIAKTDTSITVDGEAHNRKIDNGVLTAIVNAETTATVAVGNRVLIKGVVEGSVYTAKMVHVLPQRQSKFAGEVTAVTDTSVTIKNNVTGEEKVVTVEPETKVSLNGEVATTADIQVGDKGWVKFKTGVDAVIAKFISLFR